MTSLQQDLFSAAGARTGTDGSLLDFGDARAEAGHPRLLAPLIERSVMAVRGDDATSFLQGQLTNDATLATEVHAQPNGYCTPKGRLLATFLHWCESDGHYLAAAADVHAAVQKRLAMFVLRAKVKLVDASQERLLFGIAEQDAEAVRRLFGAVPDAEWGRREVEGGALIRVPGTARHPLRLILVTRDDALRSRWPALREAFPLAGPAAWRLTEIEAGMPQVVAATQEAFVPQMINFELIGGVNFKKGCYPGQEVVARSQYLGKLKRRMFLGRAAAEGLPAPGSDVYHSARPDQPVGLVVNAERDGQGRVAMLVECPVEATQQGSLHLGGAAGPAITSEPLPYAAAAEVA